MLKGLYIVESKSFDKIYGAEEQADIGRLVDIYAPPQTRESIAADPSLLAQADVLFGGWSFPVMNADFLRAAPRLKVVFYGAGSINYMVTDEFWSKGIPITSAYAANAVPVSEYTVSQILFCLKHGWQAALRIRQEKKWHVAPPAPGCFRSTVGIISLGMIGRYVVEKLKAYDLKVVAYDPFTTAAQAAELGVELVSLEELFRRSDVVSLHTPWKKETEGMITGRLLDSMKPGATFINTARGAVVNEPELVEVLGRRPDLFAVLDVTHPEPPVEGSLITTLPNVVLTPHIAGSLGNECQRMGRLMVQELELYLAGKPLRWAISKEKALLMA